MTSSGESTGTTLPSGRVRSSAGSPLNVPKRPRGLAPLALSDGENDTRRPQKPDSSTYSSDPSGQCTVYELPTKMSPAAAAETVTPPRRVTLEPRSTLTASCLGPWLMASRPLSRTNATFSAPVPAAAAVTIDADCESGTGAVRSCTFGASASPDVYAVNSPTC